ncbi:MAG: peptidoglycan D,D-transpeptidase FtsI family protein [Halothiobacillaceae bacterium]
MNNRERRQEAVPGWQARLRLAVVVFALGLGALALVAKAAHLQVVQHHFLVGKGGAQQQRHVEIPAHRGTITDRNGEPLAISVPLDTVWVDPAMLQDELDGPGAAVPRLAELLGMPRSELVAQVRDAADRRFLYVRRQVLPELGDQVRALGIHGIHTTREYRRYYPTGEVTATLLGFTDIDDVAQEGIERTYDGWLTGTPGERRIIQDLHGRVIENLGVVREARPGQVLHLSIDRRLQYLAHRELLAGVEAQNAKGGIAVLMDVRSGELLAMTSVPSFNPNNRASIRPSLTRNRAMIDQFEPGSAMKPFSVLAALQSGKYHPDSQVDTGPGWMRVDRFTIRDHRNYGVLDLTGILRKSSNVGATRMAMEVGPQSLWELYDRLGFGRDTGTGFPGEASGRLAFWQDWSGSDIATHAYGYGLSVTALQLASAYATLGNEGRQVPPSLVRRDTPPESREVVPAPLAREVVRMMESVTEEGGTGTRAKVTGYRVAGKTGSARKSEVGGYSDKRYITVFAGLAPASDPRLALVVVIDEPDAGTIFAGQVSGPIFREIMAGALRVLNVRPDDLDDLLPPEQVALSAGAQP